MRAFSVGLLSEGANANRRRREIGITLGSFARVWRWRRMDDFIVCQAAQLNRNNETNAFLPYREGRRYAGRDQEDHPIWLRPRVRGITRNECVWVCCFLVLVVWWKVYISKIIKILTSFVLMFFFFLLLFNVLLFQLDFFACVSYHIMFFIFQVSWAHRADDDEYDIPFFFFFSNVRCSLNSQVLSLHRTLWEAYSAFFGAAAAELLAPAEALPFLADAGRCDRRIALARRRAAWRRSRR